MKSLATMKKTSSKRNVSAETAHRKKCLIEPADEQATHCDWRSACFVCVGVQSGHCLKKLPTENAKRDLLDSHAVLAFGCTFAIILPFLLLQVFFFIGLAVLTWCLKVFIRSGIYREKALWPLLLTTFPRSVVK